MRSGTRANSSTEGSWRWGTVAPVQDPKDRSHVPSRDSPFITFIFIFSNSQTYKPYTHSLPFRNSPYYHYPLTLFFFFFSIITFHLLLCFSFLNHKICLQLFTQSTNNFLIYLNHSKSFYFL